MKPGEVIVLTRVRNSFVKAAAQCRLLAPKGRRHMRTSMANLDFEAQGLKQVRRAVRRGAHVQRAQQMLLAAGLAALCVLGVAGAFLAQVM